MISRWKRPLGDEGADAFPGKGNKGNKGNATSIGHVRVYQNINNFWTQIGTDIDGKAANDYSVLLAISYPIIVIKHKKVMISLLAMSL